MTTLNDDQRRDLLTSIGLPADAPGLTPTTPAKVTEEAKKPKVKAKKDKAKAPAPVDTHTIPVDQIQWDATMLDDFPDLEGSTGGMARASAHLFAIYRSPGRDPERHKPLHAAIGKFIAAVRLERTTGGAVQAEALVTQDIKASKEQRDIAALLAARGLTAADLAALLTTTTTKEN